MGVLVWGVPMVIATGGVGAYLDALSSQAGEDFSGVEMLATGFSVRELAFSVIDTFVLPWADVRLAAVVLVAAGIGAAVCSCGTARRSCWWAWRPRPTSSFTCCFRRR